MTITLSAALLCAAMAPAPQELRLAEPASAPGAFHAPVRMLAGDEPVRVDAPGWAAPCWADVDGDGDKDLLVGQFDDGRIHVCENDGEGNLAASRWLEAEGDVAVVPGVW